MNKKEINTNNLNKKKEKSNRYWMERKFKSKIVSVKASEVRKQAIVQLKESIELVSLKFLILNIICISFFFKLF